MAMENRRSESMKPYKGKHSSITIGVLSSRRGAGLRAHNMTALSALAFDGASGCVADSGDRQSSGCSSQWAWNISKRHARRRNSKIADNHRRCLTYDDSADRGFFCNEDQENGCTFIPVPTLPRST
jgi:hypothetical protein